VRSHILPPVFFCVEADELSNVPNQVLELHHYELITDIPAESSPPGRSNEQQKDFEDRVAVHIKESSELTKELAERLRLYQAVEVALRSELAEITRERDTLSSKLSKAEDALRESRKVGESLMDTLHRTIGGYETRADEMGAELEEAKLTEDRLRAELFSLRLERRGSVNPPSASAARP